MSTTRTAVNSGHVHSSSSGYQLPFELEREISEIAAFNFPECIPNLILVAHRFRIWIEPELYRIVVSGGQASFPPIIYVAQPEASLYRYRARVLDKARIRKFGHHVQHALILLKSPQEAEEILECLPNVSDLNLWLMKRDTWDPLIPIMENLPLRRLSIDPSDAFTSYSIDDGIPFNGPIFLNLTHLEIINSTSSWPKWKQLALLPKLTHPTLSLDDIDQAFVDRVLEGCRALELLILLYDGTELISNLDFPQKDDRVVCLESVGGVFSERDVWEKGILGGEDYWVKAQIIKEERTQARKCNAALRVAT